MKTKLNEKKLSQICKDNSIDSTKENMALAAFLNDADFREKVTMFYFERARKAVAR